MHQLCVAPDERCVDCRRCPSPREMLIAVVACLCVPRLRCVHSNRRRLLRRCRRCGDGRAVRLSDEFRRFECRQTAVGWGCAQSSDPPRRRQLPTGHHNRARFGSAHESAGCDQTVVSGARPALRMAFHRSVRRSSQRSLSAEAGCW
jgi:hypothetical protein